MDYSMQTPENGLPPCAQFTVAGENPDACASFANGSN